MSYEFACSVISVATFAGCTVKRQSQSHKSLFVLKTSSFYIILLHVSAIVAVIRQGRTEEGGLGGSNPPPPEIPKFCQS
jgi:hypothetical protein